MTSVCTIYHVQCSDEPNYSCIYVQLSMQYLAFPDHVPAPGACGSQVWDGLGSARCRPSLPICSSNLLCRIEVPSKYKNIITILTQAKHLVELFKLCQLFQLLQLPQLHCNSYSIYVLVSGAKVRLALHIYLGCYFPFSGQVLMPQRTLASHGRKMSVF